MSAMTFRTVLLQLRLQEEAQARQAFLSACQQLEAVRNIIAELDDVLARLERQERLATARSDRILARGCRREYRGVMLRRARQLGQLAGAKADLLRKQQAFQVAIQRRDTLGRVEELRPLSAQSTPEQPAAVPENRRAV